MIMRFALGSPGQFQPFNFSTVFGLRRPPWLKGIQRQGEVITRVVEPKQDFHSLNFHFGDQLQRVHARLEIPGLLGAIRPLLRIQKIQTGLRVPQQYPHRFACGAGHPDSIKKHVEPNVKLFYRLCARGPLEKVALFILLLRIEEDPVMHQDYEIIFAVPG